MHISTSMQIDRMNTNINRHQVSLTDAACWAVNLHLSSWWGAQENAGSTIRVCASAGESCVRDWMWSPLQVHEKVVIIGMCFTRDFITERATGVPNFEQGTWFRLWAAAESQCFWPEFRLQSVAHAVGLQRLRGKLGVSMQRTWSDGWVSQKAALTNRAQNFSDSPKALAPPPKLWTARHISDI